MAFCIPKVSASEFLAAFKAGKIDAEKLMDMTSAERRSHFSTIVGKDLAEGVNAAFEEKLLLKDQKRGLITWAKQMAGLNDHEKLDFISKVNKLDRVLEPAEEKAFLADLAAKKLGHDVTPAEAKAISQGAKKITELKKNWNTDTQTWTNETDRLHYGATFVAYQDYVGSLMRDAKAPKSFKEWLTQPKAGALLDIANSTKGIVASLDNSFFGRQGIRMMYTNPDIWGAGFAKSWADIGSTLKGGDPMLALKADIFSRPNAMNGKYRNGKFALGMDVEEAFPTSLPEKIPVFGRLYKASENAFTGGALRFRADLADRVIPQAESMGVDMAAPGKQAEGIGDYVNALTGRGNIGRASGEWVNAAFFSIRYLKSNWDALTMHTGGLGIEQGPARDFVRKSAAKNMLKIVGAIAVQYTIASLLWPDSVELDPRSSNFGKIRIGDTRFDITGGMSSIISLAARIAPTMHNGKWSHWTKSATTGKFTDLSSGKFGQRNALDVVEDFAEGKAAPFFSTILTSLRGTDFTGNKVSVTDEVFGLLKPMSIGTFQDAMDDPKSAPILAVMILDGLGVGASTYGGKRQHKKPKEIWEEGYF